MGTSEKESIRRRVWSALTEHDVDRFPGAQGRIPNFKGAEGAAERLAEQEFWGRSQILKCNPDSPQRRVRELALKTGKTVYMAVPRLRELQCFLELDPDRISSDDFRRASTIKGAGELGRAVMLEEMRSIDMVVAGSVAVNRAGVRIGKGGGYSDLEYGLAVERGLLERSAPVVTTVHELQVLDEALPRHEHDVLLNWIVTPGRTIRSEPQGDQPDGIYWDLLDEEKIASIPVLQERRPG